MSPTVQKYTFALACVILTACQHGLTAVVVNNTQQAQPRAFHPNVVLGENYYYVGMFQRVNWHRAMQICAYQGMALAEITTPKENELLQVHLTNNGILDTQFWLSANDLAKNEEFSWLSGSPVLYNNWGTNLTSCSGHCVRTLPSFQWTVDNCQAENYFICMQPVTPYCGVNNNCKRRP